MGFLIAVFCMVIIRFSSCYCTPFVLLLYEKRWNNTYDCSTLYSVNVLVFSDLLKVVRKDFEEVLVQRLRDVCKHGSIDTVAS